MLEAEAAFTRDLGDVMDIAEGSLKAVARGLLEGRDASDDEGGWRVFAESEQVQQRVETLAKDQPWTRITHRQAVEVLQIAHSTNAFLYEPSFKSALQTEHEKYLADHYGGPVFVTDYPKDVKSFYMLPNADGETVACFDLLIPEMGELAGGSLREHRLDPLLEVMGCVPSTAAFICSSSNWTRSSSQTPFLSCLSRSSPSRHRNMKTEGLEWYLDLRRFGSVPHGGYGLGLERLLGYITGIPSLKDVVGFPRAKGECRY